MYLIVRDQSGEWKKKKVHGISDIVVDSERRRLYVYGMNGEECVMPATLEDALEILEESGFVKANKHTIANANNIGSMKHTVDRKVTIGSREIEFSRRNFLGLSKRLETEKPHEY